MIISLLGHGSETLLSDFDAAGIEYMCCYPPVGVILNGGETIQIVKDISNAIPWGTIATVLIVWLKYRPSRKIIITQKNHQVLHAEGLSAKEMAQLLSECKNIIAIETKKPEE
jgi:hypothetical protein